MFLKTGRTALILAVAAQLVLMPYAGDAHAQRGDRYNPRWNRTTAIGSAMHGNGANVSGIMSANASAGTMPRPPVSWWAW